MLIRHDGAQHEDVKEPAKNETEELLIKQQGEQAESELKDFQTLEKNETLRETTKLKGASQNWDTEDVKVAADAVITRHEGEQHVELEP